MKISYKWLCGLADLNIGADEAARLLTESGLEVESIERQGASPESLRGLVVGEVLTCEKHPGADRLKVTTVDVGGPSPLHIVCGAPNVAAGQKVVVATVGTKLHPTSGEPFTIKKSKIRGEVSEGMLCAGDEIGLNADHEGILLLPSASSPGSPVADILNTGTDSIFEIGLTPNRSDAASHLGVARELCAILNTVNHTHIHPHIQGAGELPPPSSRKTVDIRIEDAGGCRRYSGVTIDGVRVAESPAWLQEKLRAVGVRPVNNIVDITNFVLHELGQPLHAFDAAKLEGSRVIVRRGKDDEPFTTLDGVQRKLSSGDLVIADEKKPLCLAGVFGGSESGVSEGTTTVFLESAYFDPSLVRQTARHHGLNTDASFRFERGADPEMTVTALLRAANLVLELAGGTPGMEVSDVYPEKLAPYKVAFSYFNCTEVMGKDVDRHLIKNIILNLGIEIESEGSDGVLLLVPRYRADVTREIDVIEEVMRIYGYNHIPPNKHISFSAPAAVQRDDEGFRNRVVSCLEGFGFNEIMTLSMSPERYYTDDPEAVRLLNPLSADLAVMRGNLLYSALDTVSYNLNRKAADLKLFEIGRIYRKRDKYEEQQQLALTVTGRLFPENPFGLQRDSDLLLLRSVVDGLLAKCGVQHCTVKENKSDNFSHALSFSAEGTSLAVAGAVSPAVLKRFDIRQPVFHATVNWKELEAICSAHKVTFREMSKFPSVRRDLALLIRKDVKYADIEELAYSTEKKYLKSVNLFDIYEDEKLGDKRSYAVSFTLEDPTATLTDEQIDGVMNRLVSSFRSRLGAELR